MMQIRDDFKCCLREREKVPLISAEKKFCCDEQQQEVEIKLP
jgi:hypothetical protein